MKSKIILGRIVCSLALLSMATSRTPAAENPRRESGEASVPASSDPGRPARRPLREIEKEVVTFLGVETAPVSPTLSSQLGLPRDAGLVVVGIVAESAVVSEVARISALTRNCCRSWEATATPCPIRRFWSCYGGTMPDRRLLASPMTRRTRSPIGA